MTLPRWEYLVLALWVAVIGVAVSANVNNSVTRNREELFVNRSIAEQVITNQQAILRLLQERQATP